MIRLITRGDAALDYAQRGWHVFPVYEPMEDGRCSCGKTDCSSPAKHPRTRHGVLEATTDQVRIRAWWTQWPDANIGLATGRKSRIVVMDIDPRHGGDKSLAEFEAHMGRMPETLECLTGGGGRHFYLRAPEFPIKNKVNLMPGIDFRGDGGYVIAPPSGHISGGLYKWKSA